MGLCGGRARAEIVYSVPFEESTGCIYRNGKFPE